MLKTPESYPHQFAKLEYFGYSTFAIMVQSMLCCNFPSRGNDGAREGDWCC